MKMEMWNDSILRIFLNDSNGTIVSNTYLEFHYFGELIATNRDMMDVWKMSGNRNSIAVAFQHDDVVLYDTICPMLASMQRSCCQKINVWYSRILCYTITVSSLSVAATNVISHGRRCSSVIHVSWNERKSKQSKRNWVRLAMAWGATLQLLIPATGSMRRVIRRQDNSFIGIVRNVKVKNCNVTRYDFSL